MTLRENREGSGPMILNGREEEEKILKIFAILYPSKCPSKIEREMSEMGFLLGLAATISLRAYNFIPN